MYTHDEYDEYDVNYQFYPNIGDGHASETYDVCEAADQWLDDYVEFTGQWLDHQVEMADSYLESQY